MERIHAAKNFFENPGDHVARYLFSKNYLTNKLVLDAGCGEAYGTLWLKENNIEIVGMDRSSVAITHSNEKNHSFLVLGDLNYIPFREVFSAIISFEVIEHVDHEERYIQEIKKCLNQIGLFIGSTPLRKKNKYKNGKPKNPYHKKEYYPGELNVLLKKYFNNVKILGQKKPNFIVELVLVRFKKFFKIFNDYKFYSIHNTIRSNDEKIIWITFKK